MQEERASWSGTVRRLKEAESAADRMRDEREALERDVQALRQKLAAMECSGNAVATTSSVFQQVGGARSAPHCVGQGSPGSRLRVLNRGSGVKDGGEQPTPLSPQPSLKPRHLNPRTNNLNARTCPGADQGHGGVLLVILPPTLTVKP